MSEKLEKIIALKGGGGDQNFEFGFLFLMSVKKGPTLFAITDVSFTVCLPGFLFIFLSNSLERRWSMSTASEKERKALSISITRRQ